MPVCLCDVQWTLHSRRVLAPERLSCWQCHAACGTAVDAQIYGLDMSEMVEELAVGPLGGCGRWQSDVMLHGSPRLACGQGREDWRRAVWRAGKGCIQLQVCVCRGRMHGPDLADPAAPTHAQPIPDCSRQQQPHTLWLTRRLKHAPLARIQRFLWPSDEPKSGRGIRVLASWGRP